MGLYHRNRQVFHTFHRAPRPASLLLREVRMLESLAVNDELLAEQIDTCIRFHVMGFRAEQAYKQAHEQDCAIKRPFIEIGKFRFYKRQGRASE